MERITKVWFSDGHIQIATNQEKRYTRPLECFPILKEASDEQRAAYTINKYGDAIRWPQLDEDIHISSFFDTTEPDPDNILSKIFERFPQLNVSEIARTIGIHKSLLAKYIYGTKKPSQQRTDEILETLRKIGRDLANI